MFSKEPLPLVRHKRAFDLIVGSFFVILASPLFVLFIALILLEHTLRGRPFDPLFYKETRISRGTHFMLCKFNIFDQRVVNDLRQSGVFIHTKALEHRGQLIFVGKILKQIYLDELPQLFNVLKGDMSLVGPRPLNLEVYGHLCTQRVPAIALIQGGMTGSYQSYKNAEEVSAATLEAEYLTHYERGGWYLVLTDLRILARTVKVLLRAKGV